MNRIDLWLSALDKAFASTGQIAAWPMPIAEVAPYFSDLEAADLYKKMKHITKPGSDIKLSDLFVSPGATKGSLMDLIIGLKVAKPAISPAERVWFVEKIFDALESYQAGDIFCLDGTNRVLSQKAVQDVCGTTPWLSAKRSGELVHAIYKIASSIKALIWSLYFYGWDDVGYQHHGPYRVRLAGGRKASMVVSDFFDIRPAALWPEMESFAYGSAKFMALYPLSTKVKIDIFDHPTVSGILPEQTLGMYLEIDGKVVSQLAQAEEVCRTILARVAKQHDQIRKMPRKGVVRKFVESRYYAFRKWRMAFGEDWRPPREIFERIQSWPEIIVPESEEPDWSELTEAFDPRTDFVPGQ